MLQRNELLAGYETTQYRLDSIGLDDELQLQFDILRFIIWLIQMNAVLDESFSFTGKIAVLTL